jgi:hypothetical protein
MLKTQKFGLLYVSDFSICSFSSAWKKTEPKEDARVPLDPARRRHGRSTRKLARRRQAQTVRALISARNADARRGTKGSNQNIGHRSQVPLNTLMRRHL